jgi:hypothetical protein
LRASVVEWADPRKGGTFCAGGLSLSLIIMRRFRNGEQKSDCWEFGFSTEGGSQSRSGQFSSACDNRALKIQDELIILSRRSNKSPDSSLPAKLPRPALLCIICRDASSDRVRQVSEDGSRYWTQNAPHAWHEACRSRLSQAMLKFPAGLPHDIRMGQTPWEPCHAIPPRKNK